MSEGTTEGFPSIKPPIKVSKRPEIQSQVDVIVQTEQAEDPGLSLRTATRFARKGVADQLKADGVRKELKRAEEQAFIDKLSGLPNRRWFDKAVEIATAKAKRTNTPLCAIFMDLDHFKWINGQYKHKIGDRIIQQMKEIETRTEEPIIRHGGEEFVQLVNGKITPAELPILLQRYSKKMSDNSKTILGDLQPENDGNPPVKEVTLSYGIAQYNGTESAEDFIARANMAMHKAKNTGRNKQENNGETTFIDIPLPPAQQR